MKSRAERRHLDFTKAIRKRKLYKDCFMNYTEEEKYDNFHQYSKNKIHCHHRADAHDGVKTNNRGRQKWYGVGSKNWKPSDLRKVVGLMEQLQCLI